MLMAMMEGMAVATVTPFKPDGGIDTGYIYKHMQFLEAAGIQGIVPAGTNGEFPSMTMAEKKQVFAAAAGAKGGLFMIAGIGSCNLSEARELADYAAGVGADAVLSVPPYYYSDVDDSGLAEYFLNLLDSVEIPLFLYNIPQYSGTEITDALVDRLLGHARLAGIKDSGGNSQRTRALVDKFQGLKIFGGSDSLVGEALAAGASGVISGVGNFLPELTRDAWEASLIDVGLERAAGKIKGARSIIKRFPWIAATKYGLSMRGMPETGVRPPLSGLSEPQRNEFATLIMEDFADFF